MSNKSQKRAYLLAMITVMAWSTIASAFHLSLRYIGYMQLLLMASVVSSIVLFAIIIFQKKVPQLKEMRSVDYLNSAFLGFLNPFLYYVVLLKAYTLLKAQEAGTLNYIWPITLVLLSIPILKQKINLVSILAIFISFAGIVIISTNGNILDLEFRSPMGVLLAVGSSVFWALYWIFNMRDKRDEVVKLFMNFIFGSLFVFLAVLYDQSWEPVSFEGIAGGIYIGLFEMGLTFFIWLKALKYSENTARVANLIYFSPFISLLIISTVVGEAILPSTFVGLLFVVAGIVLQQFAGKRS
ncbi:MAG: DMT family transporter [Chlorobi bacterium]|nr:DMT family transporter [Chlorobiota bacterium]